MKFSERIEAEGGWNEIYEEIKRKDVTIAIPAIKALTEWEDHDEFLAFDNIDDLMHAVRSRLAEDDDLITHMHYEVPLEASVDVS